MRLLPRNTTLVLYPPFVEDIVKVFGYIGVALWMLVRLFHTPEMTRGRSREAGKCPAPLESSESHVMALRESASTSRFSRHTILRGLVVRK